MPAPLFSFMGRHAALFLGGGVFLGIAVPDLASALRPALGPLVALLLGVSLLRLDWQGLFAALRRPGVMALATLWYLGLCPVLVWGLTAAAGVPSGLAQALVLNAAAPALVGSVTQAQLIGLDAALAVVLVVVTTFFLPLTLSPVLLWLLDVELFVDLAAFYLRFLLYVGLPFAAAWALRRWLPEGALRRRAEALDGMSVAVLLLAALAMMDGVAARLAAEPATVLLFLLATAGFNLGFQVLGALVFWRRGRYQAFSLGLATGNRNTALILVLTGDIFGSDLALYIAMAQIPIYLLPLVARPVYRRLLGRDRPA